MRAEIQQSNLHRGEGSAAWGPEPCLVQGDGNHLPVFSCGQAFVDEGEHPLLCLFCREYRGQSFNLRYATAE